MTRVFLVDDHEVVRRGIADLLEAQPDLQIVGEASTFQEALAGIGDALPDVAVLDVHLVGGNGVDLCRQIRAAYPSVRCLILTAFDDDDALVAAVVGGAAGYLVKSLRTDELVKAIRAVGEGQSLIKPSMLRRARRTVEGTDDEDPRIGALSMREKQVLSLIAEGLSNRQIGERMGLAEKTVKNYVSSLLNKLGLERRTQAAILHTERSRGRSDPNAP